MYGNDAAPNLSFDRKSTNKDLASMSEKKINKMVKKSEKKLNKLAKKDDSFTQMSNSKFEALFTSTNRDNETEYRLLFTPIAQQNIIDLLTSQPYGDDFDFFKAGPINLVRSKHSQRFDYQASPLEFANFDYELIEKHFNEYCNQYFQSFYFDLAPILSIPLYQQHKALEYIYKTSDGVTNYEIESLVNGYGSKYFAHPSTETDCILKCNKIVNSKGKVNTTIDCYSYKTVEHTTLVPVRGGDGHMHNVPVI
ncbi:MAG: hypothetical protein MJ223_00405 [Mycoplasmoidaceae bacterium]|nr:hypothetical protein [Mycoplasmoidaceae bacterium]